MQLIINTFGTSLRRKGERLIIKSPASPRPVEISAHQVQSLVIASVAQAASLRIPSHIFLPSIFLPLVPRPRFPRYTEPTDGECLPTADDHHAKLGNLRHFE